ncbi:MAG: Veg family protein [Clostridia bacterium]|nr:Veg family protein [Clostridia bacterium]
MGMIKPTKNIKDVKQMVRDYADSRVAVRVNLGRNKSVSFSGVLSGIYPALFTVRPDDKDYLGKTAYSYSDVLCGNVKIKRL